MKRHLPLLIFAAFLVAVLLPYLIAHLAAGPDHVFGGFLVNPIDGNSYLAKMYQGWRGEWQFTLPYTAEKGEGSPLFLFYLFLGHLSRWLGLPLVVVFHLARIAGAVLLFWALTSFMRASFPLRDDLSIRALLLAAFGSGIGWLAVPFGGFTSDFWVAEAYPFLSAYATPHFAVGLALVLALLLYSQKTLSIQMALIMLVLSVLLAIIQPFGVVVAAVVIGLSLAWDGFTRKYWNWMPLAVLLVGGGLPLLYQFWIIQSDPQLSAWNAQNLTPAPPVWDLLLSLSPALVLAAWAVARRQRSIDQGALRLAAIWLAVGLLLAFFPFNLQRRFLLGIYIPVAVLAVSVLAGLGKRGLQRAFAALFFLSIITNIVVVSAGLIGSYGKAPAIYLSRSEYKALEWIRQETPEDALILASPEMGRFIPAYTGRRVLYGHPFETVDADRQEQRLVAYFSGAGALDADSFVFYGPREQQIGAPDDLAGRQIVFQSGEVRVYR